MSRNEEFRNGSTPFPRPPSTDPFGYPHPDEIQYSHSTDNYGFQGTRIHEVTAHKGGQEVGYIRVAGEDIPHDPTGQHQSGLKAGEIAMVEVHESLRGKGIANHLFNEARAKLHAEGLQVHHSQNLTEHGRPWRARSPERNPLDHEHGGVIHLRQHMLYDQPQPPLEDKR